jgi:peptidoglycan hydrolase CwlO-like protein
MIELEYLKAKQDALADDMSEVKTSLRYISEALQSLTRLEEKHTNMISAIDRINQKVDGHEERIRTNENKLAAQMWIERVVWITAAGIITMLLKSGGLG